MKCLFLGLNEKIQFFIRKDLITVNPVLVVIFIKSVPAVLHRGYAYAFEEYCSDDSNVPPERNVTPATR